MGTSSVSGPLLDSTSERRITLMSSAWLSMSKALIFSMARSCFTNKVTATRLVSSSERLRAGRWAGNRAYRAKAEGKSIHDLDVRGIGCLAQLGQLGRHHLQEGNRS